MKELTKINNQTIQNKILTIRDIQVMVDKDLAEIYGVETKVFNQAVKRNVLRFPDNFRFQLSKEEKNELVTNCDRFKSLKHSTSNPYVFTEQGVSMLSSVLKSDTAIQISISIINTFVNMRKFLQSNASIFQRLENIETKQIQNRLESESKFDKIFKAIEDKEIKPKQHIFYDGQIFDAYLFVSDIVKSAKVSIKLIDNYVDESVLVLFSKRDADVKATIYTQTITKQLELDLKRYKKSS